MSFIKRFFVNLDARRRAGNLKAFMRKLGKQSGYALDAREIHSFFADGEYDVYFALKEKVADLDRQSEIMKDDLWQACVKHHIDIKEGLELELIYVGSKLVFKNIDFYHRLFELEIQWKGTKWSITKGGEYDTLVFKRASFVERIERANALQKKNEEHQRSDTVKTDEYWFVIDLNFIAHTLRDLNGVIKNWELMEVK